jgi:predicted RND superfamily exporter protein
MTLHMLAFCLGAILFYTLLDKARIVPRWLSLWGLITVFPLLIGTLAAIWIMGFSINILTLLALVLATGLVVDDAIVVLENIQRQRAAGLPIRAAAVLGSRQVFFAVVATTAVLVSVFIPISFLPSAAGMLFREFGIMLAMGVTPGRLSKILFMESMALTALGVALGILAGSLVTWYFEVHGLLISGAEDMMRQYGMPERIHPDLSGLSVAIGAAIVLVITLLTALYPAIKVRRLTPIKAMTAV